MARKRAESTVTIKDVAREAGVSIQTVSRAVNGHHEISDETRQQTVADMNGIRATAQFNVECLHRGLHLLSIFQFDGR